MPDRKPCKEVEINGTKYVRADLSRIADPVDGMPYVIARTYSAGVFAGYLKGRNGQEVTLVNARRLWKWAGAASLSEMANRGTKKPNDCMFPAPVISVILLQTIEIITCTESARISIQGVPEWKA